jgi:hypothetical protein
MKTIDAGRALCALVGGATLALGVAFYLAQRPQQAWNAPLGRLPRIELPALIQDSTPSFVHVVAFSLLLAAVSRSSRRALVVTTLAAIAWESAQGAWGLGTFDGGDLVACGLGALVAAGMLRAFGPEAPRAGLPALARLLQASALASSLFASVASSEYQVAQRPATHDPIYMSYEELRAAFHAEPPRTMHRSGKILVSGSYLLVSEPNRGIHVFDNADPKAPKAIAFLNLPGNLDLAAKGDVIYADSFVDLVAIQASDGGFREIHREQDVFGYDPYQVFADQADEDGDLPISFGERKRASPDDDHVYIGDNEDDVDPSRGVIIGATPRVGTVAKKKAEN